MTTPRTLDEGLDRALLALEPCHDRVVIIGGMAARLLCTDPRSTSRTSEPITTTDLDVLCAGLSSADASTAHSRLLLAGFHDVMEGDLEPPVTTHVLETEQGPVSVEFLERGSGPARTRAGRERGTSRIGSLTAQRLVRTGILLIEPWTVTRNIALAGEGCTIPIRVPNPCSFIVQKLLIHPRRKSPADRAKDLLYLVEMLVAFGDRLDELAEIARTRVWPAMSRTERRDAVGVAERLGVVGDVHLGAALQAREAGWGAHGSADALAAACREGLGALLPR
jgi:hypothetical protein